MKIGVIGAGWYGNHIALALKKAGFEVFIFEKNGDILNQISGHFGIRLHAGPHYPRSKKTRESCKRAFEIFINTYPELIVEHNSSIYALGMHDSDNNPSKVDYNLFKLVCEESDRIRCIELDEAGYHDLWAAWDIYEPSILVGNALREAFKRYLSSAGITVINNFNVQTIDKSSSSIKIISDQNNIFDGFDYVINTTGYQSFALLKEEFPFHMEVTYQTCLALVYEDSLATSQPFSFIVMDGWFPCLMPYCDREIDRDARAQVTRKYILTHGKWTIMGSFNTYQEADNLLMRLTDDFIESNIKQRCESEMSRFWPAFEGRFRYLGWKGVVLPKLKTTKEFRSAVTFEHDKLIHVIPGKVSNIFDVEEEVLALINNQNILSQRGLKYINGGVLDDALQEISEIPAASAHSTCNLQTYDEITRSEPSLVSTKPKHSFSFWRGSSPNPIDANTSNFSCCNIS